MKKFLLSLFALVVVGAATKVQAQCNGADVFIYNVSFSQNGQVYSWSYNWTYVNGNASILVVYKCGGVVVGQDDCHQNLNDSTGGSDAGYFDFSTVPPAQCPANAAKEIEIRIYASSNCNGTFCTLSQSAPLPVTFAMFKATRNSSNVNLIWETSLELNNTGFFVERNIGGNWEELAFVPTQSQGGFSNDKLTYNFNDVNIVKGITQYRLRQVDIDGKNKYSEVRTVRADGQPIELTVYPNPSTDGKVNLAFDDATGIRNVSVLDMSGRVVRQFNGVTNNNITIENLMPGMYTVRVVMPETGAMGVQKIVVNKR